VLSLHFSDMNDGLVKFGITEYSHKTIFFKIFVLVVFVFLRVISYINGIIFSL